MLNHFQKIKARKKKSLPRWFFSQQFYALQISPHSQQTKSLQIKNNEDKEDKGFVKDMIYHIGQQSHWAI